MSFVRVLMILSECLPAKGVSERGRERLTFDEVTPSCFDFSD